MGHFCMIFHCYSISFKIKHIAFKNYLSEHCNKVHVKETSHVLIAITVGALLIIPRV